MYHVIETHLQKAAQHVQYACGWHQKDVNWVILFQPPIIGRVNTLLYLH